MERDRGTRRAVLPPLRTAHRRPDRRAVRLGGRPVLYVALEDPAHALAEALQALRGKREVRRGHLRRKDRWWSAFGGQWHVAVLYLDRVEPRRIRYGPPDPLHLAHPVVHAAAGELGLRVAKP